MGPILPTTFVDLRDQRRCGDCAHWQVIDSSQLADGTPPENHVGRCRGTAEVPGWARARRRSAAPYNATCFASNGHQAQAYGEHARRGK